MRAFVATVRILIDPRIVGPDASTDWISEADMADEMSAILSDNPDILDWAYIDVKDANGTRAYYDTIQVDPDNYEEGEFLSNFGGN